MSTSWLNHPTVQYVATCLYNKLEGRNGDLYELLFMRDLLLPLKEDQLLDPECMTLAYVRKELAGPIELEA